MAIDSVWVVLECGHRWKPRPIPDIGVRWYCEECDDIRSIVEIREFLVRCECGLVTRHGGAVILAQQAATKHVRKNPTHRAEIFCGKTPAMIVAGSRVGNPRDVLPF